MAIRWIKNVVINGVKSKLEIQLGNKFIGDKTYTRIDQETERWFDNKSDDRDMLIHEGLGILKERLKGKKVTLPDGSAYNWIK
jgi:hypothetical protein